MFLYEERRFILLQQNKFSHTMDPVNFKATVFRCSRYAEYRQVNINQKYRRRHE
jgi:hypothetical protein